MSIEGTGVARGLFVAFEGGDGAGKSTQIELLAQALDRAGHEVVRTREPGGTRLGVQVRRLLLRGERVSPRAEALLFAADRAEHVATLIAPALERGAVVLTDRFADSTLAYQGARDESTVEELRALSGFATAGLVPDLTVLLDVAPEVGRQRRSRGADRIEAEPVEFHRRVRSGFLALAQAEPRRYLVVDATQDPAIIAGQVADQVLSRLKAGKPILSPGRSEIIS